MSSRTQVPLEERTARARIRDAAVSRIARDGVAATSIRAVAADAGVSPPLVVHHFGGKDGLRRACDEHVVAVIRDRKRAEMAAGTRLDPVAAMRDSDDGQPLLAYLARTLVDDSPQVRDLVDELIEDAVGYLGEGLESGLLKPTEHPRGRAVVLTLWSLGLLVLHRHARRHLDVDLFGPPSAMEGYALPATEILARGVLHENFYERTRDGFAALREQEPS